MNNGGRLGVPGTSSSNFSGKYLDPNQPRDGLANSQVSGGSNPNEIRATLGAAM